MSRMVEVSIDLDNLRHNYRLAKHMAGNAEVWVVGKSDAYGHGLQHVAHALCDADGFALLDMDDALALRQGGFDQTILLMAGPSHERELAEASVKRISIVIRNREQLDMLRHARLKQPVSVWVKVRSNINRFGFDPAAVPGIVDALRDQAGVRLQGLLMHFAQADDLAVELDTQWHAFRNLAAELGLRFSAANSAAMLRDTKTHGQAIRLGTALYGNNPFVGAAAHDNLAGFRPVMKMTARLTDIVPLSAGAPLGYGATFRADKAMRVGIVACGYGDGYPNKATTGTPVLIRGQRTRILGDVAMNVMFIDLTTVSDAQTGDWVILFGDDKLRIDEVAHYAGQRPESIQCAIGGKHRTRILERGTWPCHP